MLLGGVVLVLSGGIFWFLRSSASTPLRHSHGIGFGADESHVLVATHDGVLTYVDGQWTRSGHPRYDAMGFAPTDTGFYTSGHPGDSGLPNPLGLMKSSDGGTTLVTRGFAGERDFHTLAVGYVSHTIYLVNERPTATVPQGLLYSRDDGSTWHASALKGLPDLPHTLAVHPRDPAIVAATTSLGVFMSTTYGNEFKSVLVGTPTSVLAFSHDGKTLYIGGATLAQYDWRSTRATPLAIPPLRTADRISAIAVNPMDSNDLVVATLENALYRSIDGGQSWLVIPPIPEE